MRFRKIIRKLGPGIITGASDDDPAGIGTYSQMGAKFGLSYLWLAPFSVPLMVAVQGMCARIGAVTGKGLAGVIREHYPRKVLYTMVLLLLGANIFNIGADLGAMGAAAHLLFGSSWLLWVVLFAVVTAYLEVHVPYRNYVRILKWLCLALFAYIATAFVLHTDWSTVLRAAILPHIGGGWEAAMIVLAFLGTTISPYLFFWNTSEVVEEEIADGRTTLAARKGATPNELRSIKWDTIIGMVFSNVITFFIIITAAALHSQGITDINTAQEAAEALRPFGGAYAELLFALGIIGTGLLAIPVLAGSAGYAVAETFRWSEGLSRPWSKAKRFYTVIVAATLIGVGINAFGVNPLHMLIYSAVLNGVIAPPLLAIIIRTSGDRKIMGKQTSRPWERTLGWVACGSMAILSIALLVKVVT